MSLRKSLVLFIAAGSVALPASISAAPQIAVDSADFDVGVIKEGYSTSIRHSFLVTNPGDSLLLIEEVRPGCGCTTVGFDSVISPGKIGRIKVEVNTEHFSEGEFQKKISITSNAPNNSPFILTIRGIKRNIISTDPDAVNFHAGIGRDTGVTILLKTDRKDFSVIGVSFSPNQSNDVLGWRSSIPMTFSFVRIPDTVEAGAVGSKTGTPAMPPVFVYKLKIPSSPNSREEMYGQLVITTNLPEKPELKISGMIEGSKP